MLFFGKGLSRFSYLVSMKFLFSIIID